MLWLDLRIAYGSIPHKLVKVALDWHYNPGNLRHIILDYYNRFCLRVSTSSKTSVLHKLKKGIITIILVTLFALAMNMMAKSAEVQCRGLQRKSGIHQKPIRFLVDE